MNEDSSVMSVNTDNSAVTSAISGIPISTLRVMEMPIVEAPAYQIHVRTCIRKIVISDAYC